MLVETSPLAALRSITTQPQVPVRLVQPDKFATKLPETRQLAKLESTSMNRLILVRARSARPASFAKTGLTEKMWVLRSSLSMDTQSPWTALPPTRAQPIQTQPVLELVSTHLLARMSVQRRIISLFDL